ncbi:FAD-dependent oxidoreductase [Myxococcota bacterium]|nr:FAD-dependent oxidoreductase [Myxococcota bacterium]
MERQLPSGETEEMDLLVVGGGIHGAAVAREAALRGLRVALVERDDFGSATSWNSFKTLHGGIRHLQHLDLRRVRQSADQQRRFLQLAPHLVQPLEFVLPTRGAGIRGRAAMGVALKLHRWIGGSDLTRGGERRALPAGRVVDARQLSSWVPELDVSEFSGAAVWWDAQMQSTERMVLGFVAAAAAADACVANHVDVERLLLDGNRILGAQVRDRRTNTQSEIRAHAVVNCAGAGAWNLLSTLTDPAPQPVPLSRAVNVVLKRALVDAVALGLEVEGACEALGSQTLFLAPWRGRSLLGTLHLPPRADGCPEPHLNEVERLLKAVDRVLPDAKLDLEDVGVVHSGIQPVARWCPKTHRSQALSEAVFIDHAASGGPSGLLTLVGVKFTEAAAAAERVVDRVGRMLGRELPAPPAPGPSLPGGDFDSLAEIRSRLAVTAASLTAGSESLDHEVLAHLLVQYGSRAEKVLEWVDLRPELATRLTPTSPVIGAEVVHSVHTEMALDLTDVVMSRTELAARGDLDAVSLDRCGKLMARELGWIASEQERQLTEARRCLARTQLPQGDCP